MRALPFRKYQDFYLRLGFLKVLVQVLPADRRSTPNDAIDRRLREVLFRQSAATASTVLQRCLTDDQVASTLYAITEKTVYKILEWGHDVELVTRGNQLTERGLMLRRFANADSVAAFMSGEDTQWNPFVLDGNERACLLYHLFELDGVSLDLVDALSRQPVGAVIDHRLASELTCRSLFAVLERVRHRLPASLVPQLRVAQELSATIAQELSLSDLLAEQPPRPRLPKPAKAIPRTGSLTRTKSAPKPRQTTKSADHQTVPRFEQLADLGFVTKRWTTTDGDVDERNRWRYVVDERCRRFATARAECAGEGASWERSCFGRALVAISSAAHVPPLSTSQLLREIWRAYEATHRSIGHTPLDSVALYATIAAAENGIRLEQERTHQIMLRIKQKSLLPQHAYFASGNDLDKMFILLKPGFLEAADAVVSQLEEDQA